MGKVAISDIVLGSWKTLEGKGAKRKNIRGELHVDWEGQRRHHRGKDSELRYERHVAARR